MKFKLIIILFTIITFSACSNLAKDTNAKPISIESLSQQIEKEPKQADLYFQRAKLYRKKLDLTKSIEDMQYAIKLAPDSVSYYMELADLFMQTGNIKNTLGILTKVTSLAPQDENAWIKIGEIYLIQKQYQEVFNFANKALAANPYSHRAFFLKAYSYKEMGDTNQAIFQFQECLKQDPSNYEANIELGILFMALKNDIAITYFKNAKQIDSLKTDAYYDLGLFYQNTDRLNEAIDEYKEIIRLNPKFPYSYYNIGYIYLELLKIADQAIPYFTKAIEADQKYMEAYYNRALSYERLGDVLNAQQDYKAALLLKPNYERAIDGLNRVQSQ